MRLTHTCMHAPPIQVARLGPGDVVDIYHLHLPPKQKGSIAKPLSGVERSAEEEKYGTVYCVIT